nr:zinc finger, CCHC-type [Tanacetum cinerariifolium]
MCILAFVCFASSIGITNVRACFSAVADYQDPIPGMIHRKEVDTTQKSSGRFLWGQTTRIQDSIPEMILGREVDMVDEPLIVIVLSIEDKLNYLEQPIPHAPVAPAGQYVAPEILAAHNDWINGSKEIVGLMLMTMESEIQQNLEPLHAHEMLKEQEEGQSVSSYVLKMKGYIDNLERLGHPVTLGLGVSLILIGLRKEYDGFVQNYNMHSMGKTINELHAMLKLHEQTLPKSNAPALNAIQAGKVQKGNKHKKSHSQTAARGQNHGKGKNKQAYAPKPKIPHPPKRENPTKDSICHECREIGHWKRNCPQYLAELMKKKKNTTSGAGGSGYPKETMRYSFYYPPENKVLVARNAEFLENSLIDQEASGSLEDLKIIQEEDTHPSLDTSLNHEEDDLEIDEPQSDIVPIRRSTMTRHAPDHPKSEKWLNSMNVEMQSMKVNEVWVLVELPPNGKTVGSKRLFKKKTDIDGNVHIYKARLMAKGYTQTLRIDYEETFSPVADIRAIRILIAITAYYDYKIWQMDVKTAFLNGYLNEDVYMEQPEGFVNPKYPNRNSKRGSIPMQEKLKLSKSQGASTPAEMKHMQNVPYASAVDSIMYVVRCTRPDVAFAQNVTSRFQQNPGDIHWTTVKNILKVSCYTNAGYLADADDLKSQTGYVKFISGLGVVPIIEEPISMYCDNNGAISIANESGITKGARHFHAKVHYLREVIEFGDIKLEKVHTNDKLADSFTKALAFPKHYEHTKNIGMLLASSLITYIIFIQNKPKKPKRSAINQQIDDSSSRNVVFTTGEVLIEESGKSIMIPGVYYAPEVTLNILSLDLLEKQGFEAKYDGNRFTLSLMFKDKEVHTFDEDMIK